jgi:hypothetical protein
VNKIIIEGGEKILFKGLTYGLITSPNPPHRVWLDRNLGAILPLMFGPAVVSQ